MAPIVSYAKLSVPSTPLIGGQLQGEKKMVDYTVDTHFYAKPVHIEVRNNYVRVWFHSPSGDSSDSQIFEIHCVSPEQADVVADQWARRNWMVWHDKYGRAVDPFVETRLGSEVL